ncbi:hypothetical protein F7Q99_25700 [Streptomyces kaniharaensis]|uniref:Muconolactone delta-isomerase n=1 Tax=Streptomyces kaniharaensis TaxID=212423 RepID=A0A6N7L195_9ACTN|nr:hypothetical protein [Streptomyces kaniharaensis]MQS15573.1 hypothetical protein [Streptomyces kaniharaensis]
MQFLVELRYTEPGPLLSAEQAVGLIRERVVPSLEVLAEWQEKNDTIKAGGVFAGVRAAAFVLESDSGEEIGRTLSSLPFWHDVKWEVTPLQTFRSAAEREAGVAEQVAAASGL